MWEDYLVIEMQREVISDLSPGQLPFCSLCPAAPSPVLVFEQLFKIARLFALIYQTVLTSLAIITPLS